MSAGTDSVSIRLKLFFLEYTGYSSISILFLPRTIAGILKAVDDNYKSLAELTGEFSEVLI